MRTVLRRPRRAGTSIVAGEEAGRSHAAGVLRSWHPVGGRGGARCRAGRTKRRPGLEGGGDGRDGVLCGGHADIGGQRMTGPRRRPANLRAFPKLGPVMRWPGGIACLGGFCEVEHSGVGGRHRAPRLGAVPLLFWRRGGGRVLSEDAGERRERSRTGAVGRKGFHSQGNWLL